VAHKVSHKVFVVGVSDIDRISMLLICFAINFQQIEY